MYILVVYFHKFNPGVDRWQLLATHTSKSLCEPDMRISMFNCDVSQTLSAINSAADSIKIISICPASPEKEDQRAAGSPAALTQLALCLRLAPDLKGRKLTRRVTLNDSTPQ
jgi:hypothetical protein